MDELSVATVALSLLGTCRRNIGAITECRDVDQTVEELSNEMKELSMELECLSKESSIGNGEWGGKSWIHVKQLMDEYKRSLECLERTLTNAKKDEVATPLPITALKLQSDEAIGLQVDEIRAYSRMIQLSRQLILVYVSPIHRFLFLDKF